MAITALNKVAAKTANEICVRYPLEDLARQLLRDNLSPPQFLEALITSQLQPDAVKFLAQALPKRESIWWACEGVKSAAKPEPHSKAAAALDAAAAWVKSPSEENRRAAQAAGEAAGYDKPAGCVALAVFLSGGSMGPPNVADIPPAEHLTGAAVSGALILAAVAQNPDKLNEKLTNFLTLGADIANGKHALPA